MIRGGMLEMIEDWLESIYSMDIYELFNKFQYMGQGSGRIVFAVDDMLVIKCAKGKSGEKQCSKEYRVYNKVDDYLKDYLCPVIWYRKGMIVMPRAIPLRLLIGRKEIDTEKIRPGMDVYGDLKKISKHYGLYFTDLLSSSSWGFVGNKLVLIDYGCTGLES